MFLAALLNLVDNVVNVIYSVVMLLVNLVRGIFSLVAFFPNALGLLSSFVAFSPPLFVIFLSASLSVLVVRFIVDR